MEEISGEDAFQHLMDAAPVMIWISGPEKLCIWFNKPWLEFTGRSLEQEIDNGWAEGVHPDDLAQCLEAYVSHFDRRAPFRLEYRLRRADGEYRWVLDTGAPRFDAQGAFLGYIGSCIDINGLKRAELGLRDRAATHDMVLDALDRIAGSIAHEFKNLVGAFMGDLWFIRRHADDPDAVRRRTDEAEAGAIQSGRLLDQFLEAVRQPKSEGVRINQLIADAQLVLRGATGERHRLEMDLAAQPDETRGDPAHLQAALLNLVANARDAMPNDGTVTIVTRNVVMRPEMLDERDLTPGRYIMIAVRDTGVGMDGEVLQHAFEPLFTTKESGRGTGLGLSQVRAFARNSGGTVRIESAPGKGTTVRIYLPQTRSAARLSRPGEEH